MSERKLLFLMNAGQAQAFVQLLAAAERGDGAAACRLGDLYREGMAGLRYSPKETFHWYSRSALAGDANGQNNLGACYEHGLGCAQSYPKAVKWYRLAAAQQLGTASMNLGYCYLRGHGVAADKVEALRFFRLAVEQGEDKAEKEVERLENPAGRPKVRFVYTSEPGRHFGLVGTAGVEPPEDEIPEEEQIRRELLEVLKSGEADAAVPSEVAAEATDDELFPIYPECGMQPDDFVDTTARKYAAYLRTLEQETEERKGGDRSTE